MILIYWVLGILTSYFFLVFVLFRIFVPRLGWNFFNGFKMPKIIPEMVRDDIFKLESEANSAEEYLEKAFELVYRKWVGGRFKTITHWHRAFETDISRLWKREGFAHCMTFNYALYLLLAGSKYFQEDDVRPRITLYNFFIHQYLQVRLDGNWVDLDPSITYKSMKVGARTGMFG